VALTDTPFKHINDLAIPDLLGLWDPESLDDDDLDLLLSMLQSAVDGIDRHVTNTQRFWNSLSTSRAFDGYAFTVDEHSFVPARNYLHRNGLLHDSVGLSPLADPSAITVALVRNGSSDQ